jgi:uncharacterized protein DUF3617
MKQTVTALLLTCAVAPLAFAAGDTPGEKWKVTSSVQMSGMSMPSNSTEICKQAGDDSVPVKTDKNCEVYDVARSGNTQSFKMRCTGKDAMEGAGQITYDGKDRYKGKMTVNAEGTTMTMSYEGQKLGACDGGETNLKAKEFQAQAEKMQAEGKKMQAESCHKMAAEASSPAIMKSQCNNAEDRKTFCSNVVSTHDRFQRLADMEKNSHSSDKPLSESASYCGFSVDKERARLCTSAVSEEKLGFVSSQCPAEAEQLAKAQCAGRKYTAIADKYRGFCASYASNQPADDSATGKAKSLLDKSKKSLGGLFGR